MIGPATGIWISANSATVLRWSPELTVRQRVDSTVPGRHRSTGRPPTEKHPAGEGHRDEHMRTFFVEVAQALPPAIASRCQPPRAEHSELESTPGAPAPGIIVR